MTPLDAGDEQRVGEVLVERLNREIEDVPTGWSDRSFWGRDSARDLYEELRAELEIAGFEIVRKP